LIAVLALSACATSADALRNEPPAVCVAGADALSDDAWRYRALAAWRFARREIADINVPANTQAVFFDADCVFTSPNALTARSARAVTWTAAAHRETVALPDGQESPLASLRSRAERGTLPTL
jgi:hypothetical protein